jgi:hypothetical protein
MINTFGRFAAKPLIPSETNAKVIKTFLISAFIVFSFYWLDRER